MIIEKDKNDDDGSLTCGRVISVNISAQAQHVAWAEKFGARAQFRSSARQ